MVGCCLLRWVNSLPRSDSRFQVRFPSSFPQVVEMPQCESIGPPHPAMSEISTVANPNRHIAVLKQRVPEELALCTSNLLRRPRTRMLELGGRQCSVLQDAGAACGKLSEISLIMLVVLESRDSHAHSWTALPRVCQHR